MTKATSRNSKENENDNIYKELARELAVNYVNVSLKNAKPEDNRFDSIFNTIFKDDIDSRDKSITRNILIIGAGASMNLSLAQSVIDTIENNLGLNKLLETSLGDNHYPHRKRYQALASHYQKIPFRETDIDKIKEQLGFEGRLSMLLSFFTKEDVLNEIKKVLDFQFLPSRFYELVAHIFKHRFLDVIINYNFDELLDNAIDDEIGQSFYYKVVHDSDYKPMKEITDKNRLRIPLYIKPHGTISSKSSLLFTNEHYIDMSENMKQLLYDVFMGKVQDENKPVKYFNILIAGFSLESIELNDILFRQIEATLKEKHDHIEEINYYYFNKEEDTEENIKKFQANFARWKQINKKNAPDPKFYELDCTKTMDLADHFDKIYKLIKEEFNDPYKPFGLHLHDCLCTLFPLEEIKEITTELLTPDTIKKSLYHDYLKRRSIFHLLYEMVKWHGRLIPKILYKERVGKYYKEYLKSLTEEEKHKHPNIIDFLNNTIKGKLTLVNATEEIYEYTSFTKAMNKANTEQEKTKLVSNFIKTISEEMVSIIKKSKRDAIHSDRGLKRLYNYLYKRLCGVYYKGVYEITPIFDDTTHARFACIHREQLMLTSITLTSKFFEFAYLKESEWDELWFSSDSATPIYNLHRHCTKTKNKMTYLQELNKKADRKITVLCTEVDKLVEVNKSSGRNAGLNKANKKLVHVNNEIGEYFKNYYHYSLDAQNNIHHIALFLKNGVPKYGIYFFKPDTDNRINPFYCDNSSGSKNDVQNLLKLKEIFEAQRNISKRVIKNT